MGIKVRYLDCDPLSQITLPALPEAFLIGIFTMVIHHQGSKDNELVMKVKTTYVYIGIKIPE